MGVWMFVSHNIWVEHLLNVIYFLRSMSSEEVKNKQLFPFSFEPISWEASFLSLIQFIKYRVIFLTGPPLKMSLDWPPQKTPWLAPPQFEKVLSMAAERGEIPNTLTFLIPRGGPVWDFNIFWKSVTYWPTLSKFRGGPVKKITLYMTHLQTRQVTDPSISPPPPLPPAAPSSSGRSGEEPLRRYLDLVLYWIIMPLTCNRGAGDFLGTSGSLAGKAAYSAGPSIDYD